MMKTINICPADNESEEGMAAICYAVAGLADKEHAGPADPGLHHPCNASGSARSHQTPAA